jgi:hypothetical protein
VHIEINDDQTLMKACDLLHDAKFDLVKMKYDQKEKNGRGFQKGVSGMLPICASCKKIRDDKGYWNQIEAYIRDRSEADFSHGICPECAKKLYSEIKNDTDRDKTKRKYNYQWSHN